MTVPLSRIICTNELTRGDCGTKNRIALNCAKALGQKNVLTNAVYLIRKDLHYK